jgi:hypothetical protein
MSEPSQDESFVAPSRFPHTRIPQLGPLPRWICREEVEAFKIAKVWMDEKTGIWYLFSSEKGVGPIVVPNDYIQSYKPELGGYYVRYPDGFQSFIATEEFEEAFSLITSPKPEDLY